jgi:predicted aspartyl protease
MITGHVTEDGVPVINLVIAGKTWLPIIDTGFNGDLELPSALQGQLNDRQVGRLKSTLAGGQVIEEDAHLVEFPFDGRILQATATFVPDSPMLIGTNLLREYFLQIHFTTRTLQLELE